MRVDTRTTVDVDVYVRAVLALILVPQQSLCPYTSVHAGIIFFFFFCFQFVAYEGIICSLGEVGCSVIVHTRVYIMLSYVIICSLGGRV